MKRFVATLALGLTVSLSTLLVSSSERASAQEPLDPTTQRGVVAAHNVGPRFSLAPGIFFPSDGGRVGFSIAGDYRHGFELGGTILAPGMRLAGYFPSGEVALAAMGTTRLTVPVGPVGPYLMAGVGPGWVSDPSEAGLAWTAGGGLMVYIGESFAIGAEASYLAITGTNFEALFIGPSLLIGF